MMSRIILVPDGTVDIDSIDYVIFYVSYYLLHDDDDDDDDVV